MPEAAAYRRQRRRRWLVAGIALVLVFSEYRAAIYFSRHELSLYRSGPYRGPSRSSSHRNNLRNIGLSLLHYDRRRAEPVDAPLAHGLEPGQRLSWMTRLLPELERSDLYWQLDFDEAWDSPRNRRVTQQDLEIMHAVLWQTQPGHTSFVGIGGVGNDAPDLPPTHPRAGFFGYGRIARWSQIGDGAANTILIADTQVDNGPWAQGGRATVRALDSQHRSTYTGAGGQFGNERGATVMLGDCCVRTISAEVDPAVLEALSTINGGETVPDSPYYP